MKPVLKLLFAFLIMTPYALATWHPYLGVGVGLSKSQNTFKADLSNNLFADSIMINMDTTGTNESLIVGIRQQQPAFFIAGELFTSVHQFNIKRKKNDFFVKDPAALVPGSFGTLDFEVNQKYTNGVSILLGKDLTSTVDVFLKFDFFLSKFIIKYVNSRAPNNHGEESKWLYGFAPGVGAQIKLTENIATRLDYSYRIYNEFRTKNIARETGLLAASTVITGKIAPRIHQFTLALIYKF